MPKRILGFKLGTWEIKFQGDGQATDILAEFIKGNDLKLFAELCDTQETLSDITIQYTLPTQKNQVDEFISMMSQEEVEAIVDAIKALEE